jgi:hypothetical protein
MLRNHQRWLVALAAVGLCGAGYVLARVFSVDSECAKVTEIVLRDTKPVFALPSGS